MAKASVEFTPTRPWWPADRAVAFILVLFPVPWADWTFEMISEREQGEIKLAQLICDELVPARDKLGRLIPSSYFRPDMVWTKGLSISPLRPPMVTVTVAGTVGVSPVSRIQDYMEAAARHGFVPPEGIEVNSARLRAAVLKPLIARAEPGMASPAAGDRATVDPAGSSQDAPVLPQAPHIKPVPPFIVPPPVVRAPASDAARQEDSERAAIDVVATAPSAEEPKSEEAATEPTASEPEALQSADTVAIALSAEQSPEFVQPVTSPLPVKDWLPKAVAAHVKAKDVPEGISEFARVLFGEAKTAYFRKELGKYPTSAASFETQLRQLKLWPPPPPKNTEK